MWRNPQETADLVTFTEEIQNGKLHFLRRVFIAIVYRCRAISFLIWLFLNDSEQKNNSVKKLFMLK